MTPHRAADPYDWPAVLALIHRAFAYMEPRIDPPSSLHRLTPQGLARMARDGELWVLGAPPMACMVLTPEPDALYLGKVAVDPPLQGRGTGRALVALAEDRARALAKPVLRLQARVELTELHAFYLRLGFTETARTAHPGYARPTSITFEKRPGEHPPRT